MKSEVGKGTTFKIYLPAAEKSVPIIFKDEALGQIFGNERILFVDDEQTMVQMAQLLLAKFGYTVIAMNSSVEALKFLQEKGNEIDILITDLTMPGMTGIELAKAALNIRKDLPIVLCTGNGKEMNDKMVAAVGIREFLLKPFKSLELGRAIRRALALKGK